MINVSPLHYTESVAKTNKLYCTNCSVKIRKGQTIVFALNMDNPNHPKMDSCFCPDCSENYEFEVIEDSRHPFDIDD